MTQKQLADELGVSKANESKYESGAIQPNLEMLVKISETFNVSTDYLLKHKPEGELERALGIVVRELRGELSLREFAYKCSLAHTTIDNIEKGVDFRTGKPTKTTVATLAKIARACNVQILEIIRKAEAAAVKEKNRDINAVYARRRREQENNKKEAL